MTPPWRLWGGLTAILALATALVLATPVTTWRSGADEGAYLRYATYVADHGPATFPRLFQSYLRDPVGRQFFPSPVRVAAIVTDALAVRLGGPNFEALAHASLVAFLVLIVLVVLGARPLLGDGGALLVGLLLSTSPLALGMARRALTDSLNATLATLCLGLVIRGLASRRGPRWWAVTSAAFTLTFLCRELNLVLVPMSLALIALDALRRHQHPCWTAAACVSAVPIAVSVAIVTLAADGAAPAWQAFTAVVSQPATNEYALRYGIGPWYRFLLDHWLLSPWTTLLYIVWIGYAFGSRLRNDELLAWTLVPWLFMLCVAPLTKFVRWALFLDVPIRLGIAALLMARTEGRQARLVTGLVVFALVASQLLAFHRIFVAGDVYDPTTVGLLAVDGFLP